MVTFRNNNNNNNRRSGFRRNTRNFKSNGDNSKFAPNFSNNENFKRKSPGRNNHNAPKLIEKYNDLAREALSNGDKILSKDDIISTESDYFVKRSGTWSWKRPRDINVGDYLLQEDNTELEVTSISEETGTKTFYSLDVEDIDTYFQSDILVHNIPGK